MRIIHHSSLVSLNPPLNPFTPAPSRPLGLSPSCHHLQIQRGGTAADAGFFLPPLYSAAPNCRSLAQTGRGALSPAGHGALQQTAQQQRQQQAETTAASTVRRPPPQTLLKAPIKPLLFYGREGSRGRREGEAGVRRRSCGAKSKTLRE